MKRIVSILLLVVMLGACSASNQLTTENNNIKSDFYAYIGTLVNKEFDKSVEYIIPEFFEFLPKEQVIELMKQTFNHPSMDIELRDPKMISFGKITEVDGRFYSKLKYSNVMDMKVFGPEEETEEDKDLRIDLLQISFNQAFGTENVQYDKKQDVFSIYSEKDVIAASKNGLTNWKFVTLEEEQKPLLERIIPEQVWKMK